MILKNVTQESISVEVDKDEADYTVLIFAGATFILMLAYSIRKLRKAGGPCCLFEWARTPRGSEREYPANPLPPPPPPPPPKKDDPPNETSEAIELAANIVETIRRMSKDQV